MTSVILRQLLQCWINFNLNKIFRLSYNIISLKIQLMLLMINLLSSNYNNKCINKCNNLALLNLLTLIRCNKCKIFSIINNTRTFQILCMACPTCKWYHNNSKIILHLWQSKKISDLDKILEQLKIISIILAKNKKNISN